jgi:hypothetical protein
MTEAAKNRSSDQGYPYLIPSDVSYSGSTFRIYLPERLVREVGFTSSEFAEYPAFLRDPNSTMKDGAMVAWYYHQEDNKALLSNGGIYNHPGVELVQVCKLQSLTESDLESGDHGGARVSLIKGFPDELYDLRACNTVVLKPEYAELCSGLDASFVSVYPMSAYAQGTLPNVKRESRPTGSQHEHINSI